MLNTKGLSKEFFFIGLIVLILIPWNEARGQYCMTPSNLKITSGSQKRACIEWQVEDSTSGKPQIAIIEYKNTDSSRWTTVTYKYTLAKNKYTVCTDDIFRSCSSYEWRIRNIAVVKADTIFSSLVYGPVRKSPCGARADTFGQSTNVILQGFYLGPYWNGVEWNTTGTWGVPCPKDSRSYPATNTWFYDKLAEEANEIARSGFTSVWLPGMCKGSLGTYGSSKKPYYLPGAIYDVGYGLFDDYDLGDKSQLGTTPTRYGTRTQLTRCIGVMRANGLDCYEDFVLNQRNGATGTPVGPAYQWFKYKDAYGVSGGGRFPKYTTDFHNPPDGLPGAPGGPQDPDLPVTTFPDGTSTGWTEGYFGPDFAHITGKQNVNGTPGVWCAQQLNAWGDWLIKATGVQGYRLDDVSGISWDWLKDFVNYGAMKNKFSIAELAGTLYSPAQQKQWMQQSMGKKESNFKMYDQILEATLSALCKTNKFWMGAMLSKHLGWGATNEINPTAGTEDPGIYDIYRSLMVSDPAQSVTVVNEVDYELPISGNPPNAVLYDQFLLGYAYIMTIGYGMPCVSYKDWSTDTGCYGSNIIESKTVNHHINKLIWCHKYVCTGQLSNEQTTANGYVYCFQRGANSIVFMNSNQDKAVKINAVTTIPDGTVLTDYTDHKLKDTVINGHIDITVPANKNGRGYLVMAPAGITGEFITSVKTVTQEWDAAIDLSIPPADSIRKEVCRIWVGNGKKITSTLLDYNTLAWSPRTLLTLEICKSSLNDSSNIVVASRTFTSLQKNQFLEYITPSSDPAGYYSLWIKGNNLPANESNWWFNLQNTYTSSVKVN